MNDKAKTIGLIGCFQVASVWFGSHVGGGFASGNQTMQYYVNRGPYAPFLAVIAVIIIGLTYRAAWMTAKEHGIYEYRGWALKEYAPDTKIMPILFEICWFFLCLVAIATSVAGGASLLEEYGVPYIGGVAIFCVVVTLLAIFGAGLLRKASTIMTIVMAVLMLVIYITAIAKAPADAYATNNATMVAEAEPLWMQLWNTLKYAGFQSILVGNLVAVCQPLKSRKEVNMAAGIGIVLNGAMIALSIVAMVCWLPTAQGTTLPIFTIIDQNLGGGWMKIAYSVVLCLAFISTATGVTFGSVARFGPLISRSKEPSFGQNAIVSIAFVVVGSIMSLAGLTSLVSVGYGWCGVFAIPIIIIPCIILNIIRKPKPFAADGADE